ncbi:P-loop containing nucleoside triphosphate hydrolase protein [Aspergillus californicus]
MGAQQQQTRIICAGLPRTGTTSLATALDILGFGPIMHGCDLADRRNYTKLINAKNVNPGISVDKLQEIAGVSLRKLADPYNVTLDLPTADLGPELSAVYPESLVILTVRDSDAGWWKSWSCTWGAYHVDTIKGTLLRALILPVWDAGDSWRQTEASVAGWRQCFGSVGPAVHGRHNAAVIDRIPAHRLLVYNVKQGWHPLCRFLGVAVPTVPFPHVNNTQEANRTSRGLKIEGAVVWTLYLGIVGGVVYVASYLPRLL